LSLERPEFWGARIRAGSKTKDRLLARAWLLCQHRDVAAQPMRRSTSRAAELRARTSASLVAAWSLTLAAFLGLAGDGLAQSAPQPPVHDAKGRPIRSKKAPPEKITLPEPLNDVEPEYPPEALAKGIEGEVIVKLTIDRDGKVIAASIDTPAGHGFDEAALVAAKRVRFSPARRADGTPFKAIIRFRVGFTAKVEPPPRKIPDKPKTGALAGKVLIQGLDEALAGATLRIVDSKGAAAPVVLHTDVGGAFRLPDLPPGSYRIHIRANGYEELAVTESIAAGSELRATYRLNPKADGAIEVYAESDKPPREVTRRSLEQRVINRIPGTSGDALRSIESLPGVARPAGISGGLMVRGSEPYDSQIFVDGVYVPLIYHFGGLSSAVPTELLSKIDLYPGNFSARYGRALGGIIDVGIRSPRSDDYHGLAQVDQIDARLMVEGPVPLLDGWSFAAAGRRSYFDLWLGPALEELGAGVTQAPRYWDYQILLERRWRNAKMRVSFYGSDDALELLLKEPAAGEPALSGNFGLSTVFQRLQFGLQVRPSAREELETQVSLGRESIGINLGALFFNLDAYTLFGRTEYTRTLSSAVKAHAGVDVLTSAVDVSARLPAASQPGQPANQPFTTQRTVSADRVIPVFQPAVYIELDLRPLKRWTIVPGLRLDYSKDTDGVDLSPRLNTRFDLQTGFPRTTAKAGIGLFTQPPQPQQSNRALHLGLGREQEVTRQLEASLEGFYKSLDRIVVEEPSAASNAPVYTNNARGTAFGAELLIKYKPDDRFFGWLSYTLSRAVRQNNVDAEEVQVPWDQTHILSVLGSVRLGHGWEFGARFRLVSGNLVDPNVCNFAEQSCDPARVNALFHGATGAYTPVRFGDDNSERLPLFHQLDLRVDRSWQFTHWKLSMYLDVKNAYNSQNTEGVAYDYRFSARHYVAGLPILPSFGIRGER